jgi:hypothetical protein
MKPSLCTSLVLCCFLGGCAVEGTLTWEDEIGPLIVSECGGCHGGADPESNLRFDTRENLLSLESTQTDLMLVEPGAHIDSYLWHKLANTQLIAGGSGSAMPQGAQLDPVDIDIVAEWIDAGAE